jgi:peptidoglycan/xylan/chitin deacetylase (PgdA/CDA1 family)
VEETEVKSQVEPEGKDELRLATNRSLDDAAAMRGLEQSAADETEEVAGEAAPTEQDVAAPAAEEHPEPVGMVEIPETPETAEPVVAEPVADTTTETAPETLAPGFMLEVAPDSAVPPPSSFDLPDVADFNWPPKMPEYDVSPQLHEISRGNRRVKQLALTFDDGPHPEYTSQLLETLAAYEVPATFFFVGIQAKAHPQWVRETYAAGHELASQTYDHYRLPKLPLEEKVYQIDEYQRLIEGLVGMTPRFLRPPGGQLDPQTRQLLKDRGMVMALWDVATNDTKPGASRDDILRTMKRGLRPGTIILAHDGVQATIDALPEFIEYARNRGYEFVTMSELAAGLN